VLAALIRAKPSMSSIPARFIEGLADGKEIVTLAKQVAASATNQTNQ
jgi:hypothetical protein